MRLLVLVVTALTLTACGTPQAVLDLSTAQVESFDVVIAQAQLDNAALSAEAAATCASYENQIGEEIETVQLELARTVLTVDTNDEATLVGVMGRAETRVADLRQQVKDKNKQCTDLNTALASRIEYLNQMKAAQLVINESLTRTGPLQLIGERLVGEQAYARGEALLDAAQNGYAANEDRINDVLALIAAD